MATASKKKPEVTAVVENKVQRKTLERGSARCSRGAATVTTEQLGASSSDERQDLQQGLAEPFLKNLSSVSMAELEGKETMTLKLRDSHFSSLGVMRQIGFLAQNRGTPDLKCEKCQAQSQVLDRHGEWTGVSREVIRETFGPR